MEFRTYHFHHHFPVYVFVYVAGQLFISWSTLRQLAYTALSINIIYIYIIYSLDKVADVVWGQLPWFGDSILPQAFAGPMFLGFGCDVCELHHGSKYCSEPLVEWVVAILCRCPPIKNQGVHYAKPRLLMSSILYGRREATLFQRNPCHHSCDTFSKLSRSAFSLSFNLPRLSQINLISMPSTEFVIWLMCFYVELPKHSHWQQCFPRWHQRWCRTATLLAFRVSAGSTAWQVNSVRYVVWKHQEAIPPKERTLIIIDWDKFGPKIIKTLQKASKTIRNLQFTPLLNPESHLDRSWQWDLCWKNPLAPSQIAPWQVSVVSLFQSNIAMENDLFVDALPIKNSGFHISRYSKQDSKPKAMAYHLLSSELCWSMLSFRHPLGNSYSTASEQISHLAWPKYQAIWNWWGYSTMNEMSQQWDAKSLCLKNLGPS